MKKLTRNDLTGKPVIKVGYCAAHFLLKGLERVGYTSGVYGWNADVFDAGAAYIVTGYRFHGIKGIRAHSYALMTAEKNAERVYDAAWNKGNAAAADNSIRFYRDTFVRSMLAMHAAGLA